MGVGGGGVWHWCCGCGIDAVGVALVLWVWHWCCGCGSGVLVRHWCGTGAPVEGVVVLEVWVWHLWGVT